MRAMTQGARVVLALCLLAAGLAGCGDLPRPFQGRPGATARRLSAPPPARLAVPTPPASLLPQAGATAWAGAVAKALVLWEVPAFAEPVRRGDWRLVLSAELRNGEVVPSYAVLNPKGEQLGISEGPPVPAQAWAGGDPTVLKAAADSAAPGIATLLTRIEAALQQSDPNSLVNRPARIFLAGVTGAPGDGNTSLDRLMRLKLPPLGPVVQDTATGADFTVQGKVATAKEASGQLRVEIQWIVTDARGQECGRVIQINEVPPGTLDSYWGDVAAVVTDEASGGVRDVILNQTGARRPAAQQAGGAAEAKPGGAGPAVPPPGAGAAATGAAGTGTAGPSAAGTGMPATGSPATATSAAATSAAARGAATKGTAAAGTGTHRPAPARPLPAAAR